MRPGSFDPLSPLDTLADNDFMPIKSLPVPRPRRMGSSETISSSSSRDARSDRGRMSPTRGPSPPPVGRPSPRPFSIMSQSTEQDLLAIAEMLSPAVEAAVEEEPIPEGPPMAELESFPPDMFAEEALAPNPARDSMGSTMSSLYSSYQRDQRESSMSMGASARGSIYTDSDGASYFGDDMPLPDPGLLAAPFLQHGLRNLHLPRGSLPMPPLDDSRSLSSSTSYSSLRTPSLSRTSSAYLSSPPISPTSSHSPIDAPGAGPSSPHTSMQAPNNNNKLLGIIEESLHSEDSYGHARRTSEATEVVNFEDSYEEPRSSQTYAPSAYQDRRQPPRSDSRGEMRSPAHTLYKSDSRSDLRSPVSRNESRTEMRAPPPPQPSRSPPPGRRMPELQRLKISPAAPSLSSAPVLDISSTSPFNQAQYAPQPRSAHPSTQRTLPFAPEPRSVASSSSASASYSDRRTGFMGARPPHAFADEEPSPYAREMQSPFGRLHSAGGYAASEQFSPANTAEFRTPHTPDTPASFQTARSPTYAAHPAPERLPPPPPVPPSPVLSATSSSSSSHKSLKKAGGLGKLFGKGGSDKSSKKSTSEAGSVNMSSAQSVSSLELGNSKAEEKRLKKEAAKARTERLAQDLAEKQRRRAEAAKAAKSSMVKEKSKKPWEEGGGLYEGISYF